MKEFNRDIRNIKDLFDADQIKELTYDERIYDRIMDHIESKQKK